MAQVVTTSAATTATENTVYGLDESNLIYSSQPAPVIYGGGGNDYLANTGTFPAYLYGGLGTDTVHGGSGADVIYGEDGNDLLAGGDFWPVVGGFRFPMWYTAGGIGASGNDYLDGGAGSDAIYGLDGDDIILGGEGDDQGGLVDEFVIPGFTPQAGINGVMAILRGLFGGDGNDFIDGGRGDDRLDGDAGNDSLYGGLGANTLHGGTGDDLLVSSGTGDVLYGDSDNDRLYSVGGSAVLYGGLGNDLMACGSIGCEMRGGDGNDVVFGGIDADTIHGDGYAEYPAVPGNGSDSLGGYFGIDLFYGGGGSDYFNLTFDTRAGEYDTIADWNNTGVGGGGFAQDYLIFAAWLAGSTSFVQNSGYVDVIQTLGSATYHVFVWGDGVTAANVQANTFFI